jgi:MSHA biogenesis protein MshP
MCLNQRLQSQQGFLLPLAIFILVVMSLFAIVLSRNAIQTNTAAAQEMISTQALYAAESGAQSGMQTLFFNNDLTRQSVDTRCNNLNATINYTVDGLRNCSAIVACTCRFQDNSNCFPVTPANYTVSAATSKLTSYYSISSQATCGIGNIRSVRTIDVGSFLSQE